MVSIYANLLKQEKAFTKEKSSTPTGLVWNTNMAAFHWFGTPICLPWLHVKTLYTKADNLLNTSKADLIRLLHVSYNTPCLPPNTLHNLCFFLYLRGISAVPREIEDNAFVDFGGGGGGQARCIMGVLQMAKKVKYNRIAAH